MRALKLGLASTLCLSLGTAPVFGQTAAPQIVGPTTAQDGAASAENCLQFGYGLASSQERQAGSAGGVYAGPPPPPPPPPPPMPVAPPGQEVQGVVITGSRITQNEFSSSAPVQTITGNQASLAGVASTSDLIAQGRADTEAYPDATPNPVRVTAEEPVSTFSIDVDSASYANVRRFLAGGSAPPRDAVRVEELINYFDYGYGRPESREEPFAVFTEVTASPWAEGRQILHVGLQGYELQTAELPPLNLVFLVDVSGSMNGADRLGLAQRSLNVLIDQLRPQDRVAMVVYAGAAGVVLQPTPGDQRLRMRCAVEALRAGGSTAGGAGLALAYQLAEANLRNGAVNRVILMTDGDFNVGVTSNQRLEDFVSERRDSGVYLSVYGYGRGNYNDARMQAIAQAGNGTAAYVDTLAEARRLFRDDFRSQAFTIADDVKIQVEFNPAQVAEYRLIGYETRLLNREDFNNDEVDAGEVGSGATVTALYEITPVGGPTQVDALRYAPPPGSEDLSGELAFVRVRYKLPGEEDSRLIERPVHAGSVTASAGTRWALAVAAFGQRLRGDPWLSDDFSWDDVRSLASGSLGQDQDGLRAEFLELVDRARSVERVTP